MAFTLTCKCPGCDRVTSHCTDTRLSQNRVEFDSVRCKQCTRGKKDKNHGLARGTGWGMFPGKKRAAIAGGYGGFI
jgi:hypothetical protein